VRQALHELVETLGARGALVVSADGVPVAAHAQQGVEVDRIAALGAAILTGLGAHLQAAGLPRFTQVEVAAEHGKLILVTAGSLFLLVLLGARLELGPSSIEIRSAAQRIDREARLTSS
jgi:predicted regulator of Ras-like GTPase activity (Roadblock/LC7/MglB family)